MTTSEPETLLRSDGILPLPSVSASRELRLMLNSRKRKIRWTFVLFFTPVALWLLLLLILPHFELLRLSFLGSEYAGKSGVTLENYFGFFKEPIYWRTFVRTAVFSVLVTCIVLAISLPLAFY